jgi:hypothetical protein
LLVGLGWLMVIEVAIGYVIAWVVGEARQVAQRADGVVDQALDAGVDRVVQVVQGKLAGDSAMQRLQVEATDFGYSSGQPVSGIRVDGGLAVGAVHNLAITH